MSKLRVAINGFGRIGRITARAILKNKNIELVAINDLTDNYTLAHLFQHDSIHGRYGEKVTSTDTILKIGKTEVFSYAERNPELLPWKKLKIDIVIECTGIFISQEKASLHLQAGAKKVVISAPPKGDGIPQIVLGINENTITGKEKILSNASCTTNCAAPLVKVMEEKFGIESGYLTTVHAYTGDQNLHDAPHKDLRRARAANLNIVPTSTGAAKAVIALFPNLKGKLTGTAIRVPVPTGSLTELTLLLKKEATAEEINKVFKSKSQK